MIVPMKRLTLMCLLRDRAATLERLRDMGAVHLTPVTPPGSEDLDAVRRRLAAARAAAEALPVRDVPPQAASAGAAVETLVAETLDLVRQRREAQAAIEALLHDRAVIAPFGSFEPASARALAARGVFVRLYVLPRQGKVTVPDGASLVMLGDDASWRYAALFARTPDAVLQAREVPLPERSLAEYDRELAACREQVAAVERRLGELAVRRREVESLVVALADETAFVEARDGMGQMGAVAYLQGYIPSDRAGELKAAATAHGWGWRLIDPEAGEAVPTLVRNPKWVEPIKAIFKMIGIVPGYHEVDISGVFLLFYSIFFAMLVGDAGYGLLFLALTAALKRFARKIPPELPRLLGILSVCTIGWGVLAGSYFGIRFESLPAVLQRGRITWLTDEVNLMGLCFLIGSIHLTVAHVWNAWRARKSLGALAQLGWVAITWTMYFMAQYMILGKPLPGFVLPLFLAGLGGVVLFMTPVAALKQEWPNHVMLPLSVIGNFGDVVSYVRLFAVGSAGAAISLAFNDMAVGGGIRSVGAGLAAALILFLAHTLNIMLSALGVIVHGVRLNTLEFSGHLGMQWTGIPFRPFRRETQEAPAGGTEAEA